MRNDRARRRWAVVVLVVGLLFWFTATDMHRRGEYLNPGFTVVPFAMWVGAALWLLFGRFLRR